MKFILLHCVLASKSRYHEFGHDIIFQVVSNPSLTILTFKGHQRPKWTLDRGPKYRIHEKFPILDLCLKFISAFNCL